MLPWTNANYSHSYRESLIRRTEDRNIKQSKGNESCSSKQSKNLKKNVTNTPTTDQEPTKTLCFETGYYGLRLFLNNLLKVEYGNFLPLSESSPSYLESISKSHRVRMDSSNLSEHDFIIEIQIPNPDDKNFTTYRAISHSKPPRLWESGKIVQHYDFRELIFEEQVWSHDLSTKPSSAQKHNNQHANHNTNVSSFQDYCEATLYIVVWPDSFTLTCEICPKANGICKNEKDKVNSNYSSVCNWWSNGFAIHMKLNGWDVQKTFHPSNDWNETCTKETVLLHCDPCQLYRKENNKKMEELKMNILRNPDEYSKESIGTADENIEIDYKYTAIPDQKLRVSYSDRFNCFLLDKEKGVLQRSFAGGYRQIRDHDDFQIRVRYKDIQRDDVGDSQRSRDDSYTYYIPILLFVQRLANPTGVCPVLCDDQSSPTGIPVQLSKNWHYKPMLDYGRFYFLLPITKLSPKQDGDGWLTYHLKLYYGFMGGIPIASHANLSLVGYTDNCGRWEQLAIGSAGETYCMDIEASCVKQIVTDIRMLATKGIDGKKWNWSDAGWGADWLQIFHQGQRVDPIDTKVAYMSHGPCRSEVHYDGWYGNEELVSLTAVVSTPRVDDFARTNTSLNFIFNEPLSTKNAYFYLLGSRNGHGSARFCSMPKVAIGNAEGLISQLDIPENLVPGSYVMKSHELCGTGPWFVSFPGQELDDGREWGKGWKAIIIRSYDACFNGVCCKNPSITLLVATKSKPPYNNLNIMLVPPCDVNQFEKADYINFEIELITLPHNATNYYGFNEAFRAHLQEKPNSWETVYRELKLDDLHVGNIVGGYLKQTYPVMIEADDGADDTEESCKVKFEIFGGIGIIPLIISNLDSHEYRLYGYQLPDEECSELYEVLCFQVECNGTGSFSFTYNIPSDDCRHSKWVMKKKKFSKVHQS